MSQDVLKRISDRTIAERDLRTEINKLEGVTEPPSFWLDIANDRTYSARHRALSICQFFKRHIREPITIAGLARLLDHPDWINSGTVTAVRHLKGELPVEWNMDETVLAIRLFRGEIEDPPVLYLRISQPLEPDDFVRIMSTSQDDDTIGGASVLEAACGDVG
jgi:hypothetical protein